MPELLIELFSEEIPARMQKKAAADFERLVCDGLKDANLSFDTARAFAAPRRLALAVDGLPDRQPDLREEKKGPKVGAPEQAIAGFLKSAGLDSLDQCEQRDTPKGAVWFAVVEKAGVDTKDVLPSVVADAILKMPWPKSMRVANSMFRWVRPLHSILAVFDGKGLAGSIDLNPGMLAFSHETRGHRFLAPDTFAVSGFNDYVAKLRAAKVILDAEDRKRLIRADLVEAAEQDGLALHDDPGLLDEVAGLVEWPCVLIGKIDDDFMSLPPEVLTTSMRAHQKYFRLNKEGEAGEMADCFAVVANTEASDGGKAIIAGNERVLRARLSDAKFFWDQDRATKLEDSLPDLEKIVFHARLGTVAERAKRMESLAVSLCEHIDGADPKQVARAAVLAKADLVSGMVGEFPELQGLMGRYYALDQGEDAAVADAIAEHYSPAGPNDACPTAPVSVAVALAEKIDTLAGFWAIDEKPTGSKDPFALRRAALGIIRLVLENGHRVPLKQAFADQLKQFNAGEPEQIADDLLAFFADRLKVHLKEEGISHDLIQSVYALGGEDDLVRLVARVDALKAFLDSEDGANLLTAYKRAANILRIEEKKDGCAYDGAVDAALFALDEEKSLASTLDTIEASVQDRLAEEDFEAAMLDMATLRGPVDGFFEAVTVNADNRDVRRNRLNLLSRIRTVMNRVADFGLIES
ncbi:MAG: glycine--tRNA ligase subunit beta [Alphaproteobacteria bacterium]